MPRVIITTDSSPVPADASILLNEHVRSVHLSTDHAATQFVQRLAWAISDAEDADHREPGGRARGRQSSAPRSNSRRRIHA